MVEDDRLYEFVYTDRFLADVAGILDNVGLRGLEDELLEDPRRGRSIPGTGGFRKIRVGAPARGKRGGARVIYYFVDRRGTVYFVMAYPKNVKENLTPGDKKALRRIAGLLEEEDR